MLPEHETMVLDFLKDAGEKYRQNGYKHDSLDFCVSFTMKFEYEAILDKLEAAAGFKIRLITDSPLDVHYGPFECEVRKRR